MSVERSMMMLESMMGGYVRDTIKRVSEAYGLEYGEVMERVGLEDVRTKIHESMLKGKRKRVTSNGSESLEKQSASASAGRKKREYILPYDGKKRLECCKGLIATHGLYTQCPVQVSGVEYCKKCEKTHEKNGTIDDRLKMGLYDYVTPKGERVRAYRTYLKKQNKTVEEFKEYLKREGLSVLEEHLTYEETSKRGRPKGKRSMPSSDEENNEEENESENEAEKNEEKNEDNDEEKQVKKRARFEESDNTMTQPQMSAPLERSVEKPNATDKPKATEKPTATEKSTVTEKPAIEKPVDKPVQEKQSEKGKEKKAVEYRKWKHGEDAYLLELATDLLYDIEEYKKDKTLIEVGRREKNKDTKGYDVILNKVEELEDLNEEEDDGDADSVFN